MTDENGSCVVPWAPESAEDQFLAIGYAAALCSVTRSHQEGFTQRLVAVLQPAITVRQFIVYFNDDDAPVGFVAWALLTDSVLSTCQRDSSYLLHWSEWNEGSLRCIVDSVAPYGHVQLIIRDFESKGPWQPLPPRIFTKESMLCTTHFGSQLYSQF